MRQVELICVTPDNNNKIYRMCENADNTFTAQWGRVGNSLDSMNYSIGQWDKKYREKLKKGYKDITALRADVPQTGFDLHPDTRVEKLLRSLQRHATNAVSANYTVSSQNVTLAQVDEAQSIIDSIAQLKRNKDSINKDLLSLYSVIPRKMGNVKKELYSPENALDWLQKKLAAEQNLLDVMRQQVSMAKIDTTDKSNLADALGITVRVPDDIEIKKVHAHLGQDAWRYVDCWMIESPISKEQFSKANVFDVQRKVMTLWHGSRNQNWLNIIKTGLLIRPSGVITTGSMFGNGIYFADLAKKSIGYTSLENSYWARGDSGSGYLALYDVLVGRQMTVDNSTDMSYDKIRKANYDSLFAKAGTRLYNNEYIIYHAAQCTIKCIVELKSRSN